MNLTAIPVGPGCFKYRNHLQGLAYKKFQHVPLYLEWAPKDIFTSFAPALTVAAAAAKMAEKVEEKVCRQQGLFSSVGFKIRNAASKRFEFACTACVSTRP